MRSLFITAGLCLLPLLSGAQGWRVQFSGGAGTAANLNAARTVRVGRPPVSIPTSPLPGQAVFPAFGLSLLRKLRTAEAGIQLESIPVRTRSGIGYEGYDDQGNRLSMAYTVTGRLGRPVVPVTAVYNYYAGATRSSGFIGLHAGAAYAAGRSEADFDQMPLSPAIEFNYRSAWGFCAGVQAGYRREFGPLDFGFQLQAKYMQFSLQHGSSDTRYPIRVLVLPVQLYAGYRFGQQKGAPAKSAAKADPS